MDFIYPQAKRRQYESMDDAFLVMTPKRSRPQRIGIAVKRKKTNDRFTRHVMVPDTAYTIKASPSKLMCVCGILPGTAKN